MLKELASLHHIPKGADFREAFARGISRGANRAVISALDGVDETMEAVGNGLGIAKEDVGKAAQKGVVFIREKLKPMERRIQEGLDKLPEIKHTTEDAGIKTKEAAQKAFDDFCEFLYGKFKNTGSAMKSNAGRINVVVGFAQAFWGAAVLNDALRNAIYNPPAIVEVVGGNVNGDLRDKFFFNPPPAIVEQQQRCGTDGRVVTTPEDVQAFFTDYANDHDSFNPQEKFEFVYFYKSPGDTKWRLSDITADIMQPLVKAENFVSEIVIVPLGNRGVTLYSINYDAAYKTVIKLENEHRTSLDYLTMELSNNYILNNINDLNYACVFPIGNRLPTADATLVDELPPAATAMPPPGPPVAPGQTESQSSQLGLPTDITSPCKGNPYFVRSLETDGPPANDYYIHGSDSWNGTDIQCVRTDQTGLDRTHPANGAIYQYQNMPVDAPFDGTVSYGLVIDSIGTENYYIDITSTEPEFKCVARIVHIVKEKGLLERSGLVNMGDTVGYFDGQFKHIHFGLRCFNGLVWKMVPVIPLFRQKPVGVLNYDEFYFNNPIRIPNYSDETVPANSELWIPPYTEKPAVSTPGAGNLQCAAQAAIAAGIVVTIGVCGERRKHGHRRK